MKRIVQTSILATLFFLAESAFALTGYEIMEKNDELPEAKTSQGASALVIDKGGKREVKEFEIKTKRYGAKTRSRINFLKPTKIQFLTHNTPGEDSLQWIKLSSGKVRKIASSDKSGSFVNSHFYYEDIGDRDIDDFKYEYVGDSSVNDEDCYKVSSVKIKGTKVYSKAIIYVRKSDYVIVRIEFFEKGKHTKTLRNEKIQKIQGIYTPRKVVMEKYKNGKLLGKSFLYIKKVKYNGGVSDQSFKREAL